MYVLPDMIRTAWLALALMLLTGTSTVGQENRGARPNDPGPIQVLIELKEELQLSAEQLTQLEAIDEKMDRENEKCVVRLSEIRARIRSLGPPRARSAEQQALFQSYLAEARPLMDLIQKNNRNAMEQVGQVLLPEQKELIERFLRAEGARNRDSRSRNPRLPSRGS